MATIHLIPSWFYDFGVSFNLLFLLITGAVAYYSLKIYLLSYKDEIKFFSIGFALISLSYLAKTIIFLTAFTEINEKLMGVVIERLNSSGLFLTYSHLILFIIGVVTITYAILKTESIRLYLILISTSLMSMFLSANKIKFFLSLSAIFLLFISYHYGKEYLKLKNIKTGVVFIGFTLLFISKLEVGLSNSYLSYLIENIIELAAYSFIALGLFLVSRKESKK